MKKNLPKTQHQHCKIMQNSFLFQVFSALDRSEYQRLRKFLASPYHNRREDVQRCFDYLCQYPDYPEKENIWAVMHPDRPYDADAMNLIMTYLLGLIEDYLALEEWTAEPLQRRLCLVRALRKREIGAHFERQVRLLERQHNKQTYRHAGFYLTSYQIQNEVFAYQVVSQRNWQENLPELTSALGHFFVMENLRWSGMVQSLRQRTGADIPDPPLANNVLAWAAEQQTDTAPAIALLFQSLLTREGSDQLEHFTRFKELLPQASTIFPPAECRDLFMAAINFCIRRQNKGERHFAHEALDLYRRALDSGILLENGILPKYTFNNIHALAQLVDETEWARQFLDDYREHLAPVDRDNIYQYNLAIFHFRRSEYDQALELLREVSFTEVYIHLDVRRMLLRSYFELGEWVALASLLDSFRAFLRRQKSLGKHRESYLNLIRFTQKLAQSGPLNKTKAMKLAQKINATEFVAEREWLLNKLTT